MAQGGEGISGKEKTLSEGRKKPGTSSRLEGAMSPKLGRQVTKKKRSKLIGRNKAKPRRGGQPHVGTGGIKWVEQLAGGGKKVDPRPGAHPEKKKKKKSGIDRGPLIDAGERISPEEKVSKGRERRG